MHLQVKTFICKIAIEFWWFFKRKRVLELGSLNVNGSPRWFFWLCTYTGVDIYRGRGVDVISPAHLYFNPRKFDVVISTEMLEHDQNWQASLRNAYDLLRDGGLMIITCAGPHRAEHGTSRTDPFLSPGTNDYYRNISVEDFESVLPPHLFAPYRLGYANGKEDLQFYGIKKQWM